MLIFSILYDILLSFFIFLSIPFCWKKIYSKRNYYGDWKERIGLYNRKKYEELKKEKNIWIHTVSIGEFLSSLPLIEKLKEKNPIVITFITKTGRKVAEEKIKNVLTLYFPFDISFIVKKTLKTLNPKLIIIVETEIWPNLILNAYRKKIPLIIINARISDKSFKYYKKMRFFTKRLLPFVSEIITKTEEDKIKFQSLGFKKESILVSGSLKFDMAFRISKEIKSEEIRRNLGLDENKLIVIFGSIHPDEEAEIVKIIEKIEKKYENIFFIIAPRYLEKTNIFELLKIHNLKFIRKTEFDKNIKDFKVFILDTYGELLKFYSICDIAFVGGSLNRYGGQNPVEPAAFGKCIICGKDMFLLQEEWNKIKNEGGGIEVRSFDELYEKIIYLIENPEIIKKIGENAYKAVIKNKGAIEKIFKRIEKYL